MDNKKAIENIISEIDMSQMISDVRMKFMFKMKGYLIPSEEDELVFKKAEQAARKAVVAVLAESFRPKSSLIIAGYQWRLVDVRFGIHTEETTDYTGVLTCNGERIATVVSNGKGGITECFPINKDDLERIDQIHKKVTMQRWTKTPWGRDLYYDFDIIAEQCLFRNCYDKVLAIEL